MVELKVMIVGTSAVETLRIEEMLQPSGCLEIFRYVGLEQALDRVPDWEEWDVILARYQERTGQSLLSLLASVMRNGKPPVIFLVDSFDPLLVTRLMNGGAYRVLPLEQLEQVLEPSLAGLFQPAQIRKPMALPPSNGKGQGGEPGPTIQPFPSFSGEAVEGFARLFRASPVGMSINRLSDGRCLDCNESYARLLDWPREALIGQVSLELGIPPDIKAYFQQEGETVSVQELAARADLPPLTFERKIYSRGRQIRNVQVHLDLIDWGGEICALSLVQDITEKEQAKEKINRLNDELERLVLVRTGALEAANRELASEIGRRKVLEDFSNRLTQVIWETPDVVMICGSNGRMQFLNKAGRSLFGLSEDASVSHLDLFSAYSDEMRTWIRDEVQPVVIRDGIWRGETSYQLPDGRVIPLSQVLLCEKDDAGEVSYYGSIARDISDFKRVELELLQSRERYRTLAEAAHDFIFMVSRDGLMEYANEYACQALGFDPNHVSGVPVGQFFPPEFAMNHLQMFDEVHEIDRPIYTEGPFPKSNQETWLGTWLVPIHSEDGSLVSILGISRDITEQKKTDEALQRALQNERKLGEMRSNFFSMTSHQFRTPLSTILLSTELLQKYGQKWDDQKRSEHLMRIQEAAKRLNGMLEDILVIGRVESGRYVCSPKDFDLVDHISQAIREQSINDRYEHELVFQRQAESLPVYQDAEVMHRVVDNLLSNAIKYSPKGTRVTVNLASEGQQVLLEVSDNGIGIPERDIKYLFQPFQRGSNAGDYPGSGIGLTIIQKSVDLMNGTISLKSKEGQGTTFLVRFPARFENNMDRAAA